MKYSVLLFTALLISCGSAKGGDLTKVIDQEVETSCGTCNFNMTGDDCSLAVRINGKEYYVEGTSIDEHGDAHASDGLCTVVRNANVKGEIKHGVFIAEEYSLIPYQE